MLQIKHMYVFFRILIQSSHPIINFVINMSEIISAVPPNMSDYLNHIHV